MRRARYHAAHCCPKLGDLSYGRAGGQDPGEKGSGYGHQLRKHAHHAHPARAVLTKRIEFMKTILLVLFTLLPAFPVTCPSGSTHIVDTLLTGDGSTPAQGKILAKGPTSPSGSVLSTSLTI